MEFVFQVIRFVSGRSRVASSARAKIRADNVVSRGVRIIIRIAVLGGVSNYMTPARSGIDGVLAVSPRLRNRHAAPRLYCLFSTTVE